MGDNLTLSRIGRLNRTLLDQEFQTAMTPLFTSDQLMTTTRSIISSSDNSTIMEWNESLSLHNTSSNWSYHLTDTIPYSFSVILILLYTFTTLAAVIGNSLAIIVFTRGKRSNTDLRLFLINLAVADLIMAIVCIPFTFAYQITDNWIFSDVMCPIVQCCQVVSVLASVCTNTAIGIDRFVAVKFPLRKRVTNSRSKLVIACIWVFALSLGIIPLVKSRTVLKHDKLACEEQWSLEQSKQVYGFFIMIMTYFLPVTILSVTYTMIGRMLWRHKVPGNADDHRDAVQIKSKRKVVKMLVTIVLLFGVCWLPLHVFITIVTFNFSFFGDVTYEIYFAVHWLSMANSFVNPVIYGFMNDNFRADLYSMMQSCLCGRWSHKKLKYRTAAMRWRLGDCNVHDSSHPRLHGYVSKTLSRYDMNLRAMPPGKRQFWRNGHAMSSPALDVSSICTCETSSCEVNDSTQVQFAGNGGGRSIYIAGKHRMYTSGKDGGIIPAEENGLLKGVKKNDLVRGRDRSNSLCDVHRDVMLDGSGVGLVTEFQMKDQQSKDHG